MTYFVRKTGNDGNGGLSKGDAWLTITYALGEISNGDTIIIGAGDYSGEALDLSGLSDVRILGDRHGTKTGDAGAVEVSSCTATDYAYIEHITTTGDMEVTGDWVILSACTVGESLLVGSGCRGCRAITCGVTDSVVATNPDGLELLSLTILGGASQAPVIINSGTGISLRNCIIIAAGDQYVISLAVPDRAMDFDHNLYWGGIGVFAYNSDTAESFPELSDWQRTGQDANSRYVDPLLTDFDPAAGSPAIDMGEILGAAEDIYGRPRYPGWYDIGAVQHILPQPVPTTPAVRRFRFESPLMSSAWIDMLSEFQRWIVHFFGLDTDGAQVTQGLTRQLIEVVDSDTTGLSERIVESCARVDNIEGSVRSLESRKWE